VFEGFGRYPNVFNGAVHRNSCQCYGAPSRMNNNNWPPQPGVCRVTGTHMQTGGRRRRSLGTSGLPHHVCAYVRLDQSDDASHPLPLEYDVGPGTAPDA
jgi:hypothetical protein